MSDGEETVVKEYLKCQLSEKEKTELSAQIAKAISDRASAEAKLKKVSTSIKAQIAQLDAEISEKALQINNGYEYRNVECRMDKDYRLGTVTITRLDTGGVIRERPMTGEERQTSFIDGKAEKPRTRRKRVEATA